MTPDKQQQLQAHLTEAAKLLYADAESNDMPMATLAEIEMTVRQQLLSHVSPTMGNFLSRAVLGQMPDTLEP